MENYQKQANDFAKKHGITLKIYTPDYGKHFDDDEELRYIFPCTLKCNGKQYSFRFGQSIASGAEEPTMYDILAGMQKYDVGDFENFCSEFGYNEDSRKAEKTYKAVCKEYDGMVRVFGEQILEEMQEIQ